MSDEKPKAKVVSICGRPVDPATDGIDPNDEAAAARRQLQHWATESVGYIGLFLTHDGIAFASSSEDPGKVLQMATLLKARAEAFGIAQLCWEHGVEPDDIDSDEDDDDAG